MTQSKTLTSLSSFTPTKEQSHLNLLEEICWEGGTRRVAASARVDKANFKQKVPMVFLGAEFSQGEDFQRGNWSDFNS